jgi:orotate phosphoribosyltransferase
VSDRDELLTLIKDLAVVHGRVTLSSGREADYYIDLRRVTLHHAAAPLIGRVMLELVADWRPAAVGGLTLGADPVATAIMHASAANAASSTSAGTANSTQTVDAFVVRKEGKKHGMQRRIEGPDVAGRRVVVLEDVSTTGGSPLTAVEALREDGAEVVGVAVIVDRGARAAIEAAGLEYRSAYSLAELGLE